MHEKLNFHERRFLMVVIRVIKENIMCYVFIFTASNVAALLIF